jgi:putative transposase
MAKNRIKLLEKLRKAGMEDGTDFLREGLKVLAEAFMELEVKEKTGADPYQRSDERCNYRNGYRERCWDTRVGSVPLNIPRLRTSSYFPSLLEPRRRVEQALLSVVQEAYVLGVSTRKVETLVQTFGLNGISKSEVSRICGELDGEVNRWRNRALEGEYPYLWLDATYIKVRQGGAVISQAVVIAYGVRETGEREVLGIDIGPAEDGAFWTEFLRQLVARGLAGVLLVISDAHLGLKEAIAAVLGGAAWQRCRVHFMRNALSRVPRAAQTRVAAFIRTIFAQPHKESAHRQLRFVADSLRPAYERAAELLEEAEEDLLAHMQFPAQHWRKLHSTNPLERINREIKRRTNVVGIFPNQAAVIRLVGALLMEQQDDWTAGKRYFSSESIQDVRVNQPEEERQLLACGA